MCGILGIFGNNVNVSQSLAALDTMHHRGPDATDYYSEDGLFLGHKRLSIIDTTDQANQPFFKNVNIVILRSIAIYICPL